MTAQHWPGANAANQLTHRAVDPISNMPELKVAAVRIRRAICHRASVDDRDLDLHESPEDRT